MIKVTKRTVRRELTDVSEFQRQKGTEPWKSKRQDAKAVGFLCIFGGSGGVLSQQSLETAWTLEDDKKFIVENKLDDEAIYALKRNERLPVEQQESEHQVLNKVCAKKIREDFFKAYPGLMDRIEDQKFYTYSHGYNRMSNGYVRSFPLLKYVGDWDFENLSSAIRNCENIAVNVSCQASESAIRGRAQYEMQCWLTKMGYKTYTFNEIHDSYDLCIYKPELKEVLAHSKHLFERKIPEFKDNQIPLPVDMEISDLKQGDFYKHGREPSEYGIKWEDLEYEDIDPFDCELNEKFDREYFERRKAYWENKGEKDFISEEEISSYLAKKYPNKVARRTVVKRTPIVK